MSRAARLGAFIVVTLAILVAGVFIIGGKQYLFSSTYQLKRNSTTRRGWMLAAMCGWAVFTVEPFTASCYRTNQGKR